MRRLISGILAGFMVLGLTACFGPPVDPDTVQESIQVIAMDTPMFISTYGRRSTPAAYASEDMIRELEAKLSRTAEDSEVSRLNGAGGKAVEAEGDLLALLQAARRYCVATGGAFDITVAPVVSAWGFTEDSFQVPGQAELDRLLELVDGAAVAISDSGERGEVQLGPGQSVDLGGIAKGYAADKLTALFQEYEVPRALAQLGGNVLAWGDRPDGTPWRVGVRDPARPEEQDGFVGVLNLNDAFAVTSGGYQRYFEADGKRYHHIIDPATGYPADSGLTSVTVVAACGGKDRPGTMCDALSTALFVMGEERALECWRNWTGDPFGLVLVTEDGRVVVTDSISEKFDFDAESGYAYQIAAS